MKQNILCCPFYILLLGLFLFSCNSDEELQNENTQKETRSTKAMGDNKYQVLGYGYDVTEEYLSRTSIKDIVLDVNRFVENYPHLLRKEYVGETYDETYFGEDFMSYSKEIINKSSFKGSVAERAKEAKFDENKRAVIPYSFSGSFNSESTNKNSVSTRYSFARIDVLRKHRQYFLNITPQDITNYLTSEFNRDINSLSPDNVVKKYGTHVLLDFVIGGTYSAYYKSTITENTTSTSKTKIVEGGVASALSKVGVSFSTSLTSKQVEEYTRKNSDWSCRINVRGGTDNGHTVTINSNGVFGQTFSIGNWLKTVDDANCVLAEVTFNRTYPIYEFISNPTKKQQIKDAVIRYLNSKTKEVLKVKPMYQLKSKNTGDTWYAYNWADYQYAMSKWKDAGGGIDGYLMK